MVVTGGSLIDGATEVDGVEVVVTAISVKRLSSLFCDCASSIPVPQSWYPTNKNINSPTMIKLEPSRPRNQYQSFLGLGRSQKGTFTTGAEFREASSCVRGTKSGSIGPTSVGRGIGREVSNGS